MDVEQRRLKIFCPFSKDRSILFYMHHFSSFFGCYFRFFVYEHALISYFFSLFSSFSQGTKLGKAELFSFSWWYWQCLLQTCSCVKIRKTKNIIMNQNQTQSNNNFLDVEASWIIFHFWDILHSLIKPDFVARFFIVVFFSMQSSFFCQVFSKFNKPNCVKNSSSFTLLPAVLFWLSQLFVVACLIVQ